MCYLIMSLENSLLDIVHQRCAPSICLKPEQTAIAVDTLTTICGVGSSIKLPC